MRSKALLSSLAIGLTAICAFEAQAQAILKIDAATQQRLGIATRPLPPARHGAAVDGFAKALDASPLAALEADIVTAAAAAAASQAEADRTRTLAAQDSTVSKRTAEAAAAQARGDAVKLALLRRRLGLEWGPSLAAMSDARRDRLIGDLAAGRATLVRVDTPGGTSSLRGAVTIDLGTAGQAFAKVLGPARTSDPRLQSAGLLALISGPQALRFGVGASAPAKVSAGGAVEGVMVPREALLRTDGRTFVYVRKDADDFERREIKDGIPDAAGLFVAQGFKAGEPVVVKGASQLLTAEKPSKADEG